VLLALRGLAAAQDDATWVFDEVDANIGGVTATAVAARLERLGGHLQTIVITHLPQVAAAAGSHHRLVKGVAAEGMALTSMEPLEDDDLVAELVRMLGAGEAHDGARRHALELFGRPGPR